MAAWHEIEAAEPEFAARIQRIFDGHVHKTMATLRRDGSPRISGTEATFKNAELWLGMMPATRKCQDLRRDPRVAVHSAPVDTKMTEGDVKLSARAIEETDQTVRAAAFDLVPPGSVLFRLDISDVVLTRVDAQTLVVELWQERVGLRLLKGA